MLPIEEKGKLANNNPLQQLQGAHLKASWNEAVYMELTDVAVKFVTTGMLRV